MIFFIRKLIINLYDSADGQLASEFDCAFFADAGRSASPISASNIVNMGDSIYGRVKSSPLAGLSYELTDVLVKDRLLITTCKFLFSQNLCFITSDPKKLN